VEVIYQVGDTAGKVWRLLSNHGPQNLTQLKKGLNSSGKLVALALGWLAREDKVDIVQERKNFKVTLKS